MLHQKGSASFFLTILAVTIFAFTTTISSQIVVERGLGSNTGGRETSGTDSVIAAPQANFGGTLAVGDPTFNRPTVTCTTLSGTSTHYDSFTFTAPAAGAIRLSVDFSDGGVLNSPNGVPAGPDSFLILYQGAFNPAAPLTNCFAANDDINVTTNRRSRITTTLPAAGLYTVVMTSFNATPTTTTVDDVLPWTYFISVTGAAAPVVIASTDFLVADFGPNKIAIYDQNLVFKSYLDVTASGATGLDFLANGNVVASARNINQIRTYNNTGTVTGGFTSAANVNGSSGDIKASSSNLLYVAEGSFNIFELNLTGTKLRGFGTVNGYSATAVLPGNKMWGCATFNTIDIFDLSTGTGNNIAPTSSLTLNSGSTQTFATTMSYSASTNTVLMTDTNDGNGYERNAATGAFIRKFNMATVPGGYMARRGITRGPGGDVYIVAGAGGSEGRVARFNGTTGAFISSTDISTSVTTPTNIVWLGNAPVARKAPFDFDGDGKTDLSIFRPAPGEWWYSKSSNGGNAAAAFGNSTDKLTPGDFTGDGKTDIAFWRPSTGFWFILRSEDSSFFSFPFGTNGDVPMPADFDGDGKTDAAVFRPSTNTWFINNSGGGTTITAFGTAGDVPVAADYDGDGKADIAIYRPSLGQWWLQRSTAGTIAFTFGGSADKTVPGDYTGDGKADVAFWRPSTGEWFILRSENQSFFAFPFGLSTDVPSPGDYDGDGKFDAAVFRPSNSTWFVQRTTAGQLIQPFGTAGDISVPNAFVR